MADIDPEQLELDYYVEQARSFIGRHFSDPEGSVDDLAAFVGVSTRTLTRVLDSAGCSWTQLRFERRMEEAARLLSDPKVGNSISDIGRACGYRRGFRDAFRRKYGESPADFRMRHGGPARAQRRKRGGTRRLSQLVLEAERREARHRLEDRALLAGGGTPTQAEVDDERALPTRMGSDARRWRALRQDFDAWIEANNTNNTPSPATTSASGIEAFLRAKEPGA